MTVVIGKYSFEGPFYAASSLDEKSGVYAILDSNGGRKLDFGESAGVRSRVENHDRAQCWKRNATGSVQYAAYYCDASTRMRIEQELRAQYTPPCGDR